MSLSKPKDDCNGSDSQQKRQSFEERICDDLCEVILQYLPLKDKLRLESVSKHFQRNIFQKQHYLWINQSDCFDFYFVYYFFYVNEFNLKAFESVLKKCVNIKSIVIRDVETLLIDRLLSENIIDLIYKNCNNLIEFNTDLAFDESLWNKLITKIDSKAFTLHLNRNPEYDINCETLALKTRMLNIDCNYKRDPYYTLQDLVGLKYITSLNIGILETEINYFQTLIENNKRMKFLEIYIWFDITSEQMIDLLNNISKLKDLIELKIHSKIGLNESSFCSSLKRISDNCLNLKSIFCELSPSSDPLSSLKVFKGLKRLEINLTQRPNFEIFRGFEGLTHLTINCDQTSIESKGLDEFLPKLRYLKVSEDIIINEETIEILSRLSDLEVIEITIDNEYEVNKQKIETNLMKNCRRIREIKIWCLF